MSQAKVERYKQEKANRKKTMRKEKMAHMMRTGVLLVIGAALIGWIGYSGYSMYEDKQPRELAEVDYEAINTYLEGLNAAE